jgi:hypothetical protein
VHAALSSVVFGIATTILDLAEDSLPLRGRLCPSGEEIMTSPQAFGGAAAPF